MASVAGSIPVTGSKSLTRDRAAVARCAHNAKIAGANPAPATNLFIDAFGIPMNAGTGRVNFEQTRPDQFSHQA